MGGRWRRGNGHLVWAIWRRQIYSQVNHGRNRAKGQRCKPKRAGQQA